MKSCLTLRMNWSQSLTGWFASTEHPQFALFSTALSPVSTTSASFLQSCVVTLLFFIFTPSVPQAFFSISFCMSLRLHFSKKRGFSWGLIGFLTLMRFHYSIDIRSSIYLIFKFCIWFIDVFQDYFLVLFLSYSCETELYQKKLSNSDLMSQRK